MQRCELATSQFEGIRRSYRWNGRGWSAEVRMRPRAPGRPVPAVSAKGGAGVSFEPFKGDRQVGPTEAEPEVIATVAEL